MMRWLVPVLLIVMPLGILVGVVHSQSGGIYENVTLEVLDIGERSYDGGNALAVSLSVSLKSSSDYSGYFNVTKKGVGRVDGDWILSESGSTLYFPYIEPQTDYTVTVYQGITANNGSVLAKTSIVTLKTRDIASALTFGGRGLILPSENCPGLPVVTVNVAEADIEFHRVRDTEIVKFMGSFYRSGPTSAYDLKRLAEYCTLVFSGRFRLDPPANKRRTVNIPIQEIKQLSQPGLYLAVMKQPGSYDYQLETTCFMISDLGLHARTYRARTDVYLQSLSSGDPLPGVEVTLWGEKGEAIAKTVSSPHGVAVFKTPPEKAHLISATSGSHFSVLELGGPALDLSDFEVDGGQQRPVEPFISASRDIYRPGETVVLSMLLRSGDGDLLPDFPIPCVIKGPDNKTVREFVWHSISKGGYYQYEYKIPDGAATGTYRLVPTVGGAFAEPFRFQVEEFLPERLELEFVSNGVGQRFIQADEELRIGLRGSYLYGAPASGNLLSSTVRYSLASHPLPNLKDYFFGDEAATENQGQFELDDLLLDEQGEGNIQITPRWRETSSPLKVAVSCSLHESGGRPVSRRSEYTVWPALSLVGLRPLLKEDELENGGIASYEIIAATKDGSLAAANNLSYRLIRSERDYYWVYDEYRGWRQDHTDKSYTVLSGTLEVAASNPVRLDFPVENGHYRLEIRQPETQSLSAHEFNVGQYWWWYGREKSEIRPESLALHLDKQRYKGGDTAHLTISSPYSGKGFVVVEADEPLWSAPLEITEGPVEIDIPVDPAWKRHDIYVSAMVLRPVNVPREVSANRAMGVVHLPLDRESRRLLVEVEAPDKIEPFTHLAVGLKVRAVDDQIPGRAMVTLAAVDVGALNVTAYPVPDPFTAFFGKRRYGVESHDLYSKVIEAMGGKTASLSFGGDADLSHGGTRPKSEVRIVSLFSGPVELDQNGSGSVELDIPDFNGRLRLAALAFTDDKFGSSDALLTVAAPVVAELGLPRFLSPGDQSIISLDLTNMTEKRQKLSWRLESDEIVQLEQKEGTADLASGEKLTVSCPVKVAGHGASSPIHLAVTRSGEGEGEKSFSRQYSLGFRPGYPALQRRRMAVLQPGEEVGMDPAMVEDLAGSTVETLLSVANRPPLDIAEHLDYLLHYPYGCLEQTTASAFPFLMVDDELLAELKIKHWDRAHRSEAVNLAVSRLATLQRHNGGFGLWSSDSSEEQYLTVLATDFLLSAEKLGYSVPGDMLSAALKRLGYYLDNGPSMGLRYSEDAPHYRFAFRSYAAYMLAGLKRANLGSLRLLYDRHKDEAKSGLPLVHLGLALVRMGDAERGKAAVAKGLSLHRSGTNYLGDYGSPIRDTALMIALLTENESMRREGADLIFDLADRLRGALYLSTQERFALLRAEIGLRSNRGEQWHGLLTMGGEQKEISSSTGIYQRFAGMDSTDLSFRSESRFPLYAELRVSGYGLSAPEPLSEGVAIERGYYTTKGERVDLNNVRSGDLLLVSLSLSSEQRIPDLLVADLLPAGLELENQNLLHAVKLEEIIVDGTPVSQQMQGATVAHREYRDDRFVAALDLFPGQGAHLYYLARAVTPGVYTIPPPLAEDMYRPMIRAIGRADGKLTVLPANGPQKL